METAFIKALNQIKADEDLKKKTVEYILNAESNIVSINTTSENKKKPFFAKKLVAAACLAAVLCALPIGAYAYYKTPTSYVSVDINPSVELGINTFGKVVPVKAYNTDGETVIAGLALSNANVESAVRLIVKSASQNGFVKADGSTLISVTAETNNDKKAEELKQDAQTGAKDAIDSEEHTATIETEKVALDRRDEAITLGITPGKLNLIQKLQELDPTIKTEDYKNATVTEIQKKFIELKKAQNGKNDNLNNEDNQNINESASPSTSVAPSASPSTLWPHGQNTEDDNNKPNNHSFWNNNGNGANQHDDDSDTPVSSDKPSIPSHNNNNHNSYGNNGNSGHSNNNGNSGYNGFNGFYGHSGYSGHNGKYN